MKLDPLRNTGRLLEGLADFLEWWAPPCFTPPWEDFDPETKTFLGRCPEEVHKLGELIEAFPNLDNDYGVFNWPPKPFYVGDESDNLLWIASEAYGDWDIVCSLREHDYKSLYHVDGYDEHNPILHNYDDTLEEFITALYFYDICRGLPEDCHDPLIDDETIFSGHIPSGGSHKPQEIKVLIFHTRPLGFIEDEVYPQWFAKQPKA